MHPLIDGDDDRLDWEKATRPRFTAAEDIHGEAARPSSLIPVHKLSTPDPLYDMQLMRALKMANEQTVRELGPLPPGGLPVAPKRRLITADLNTHSVGPINEKEDEEMKFRQMALATVLSTATTVGVCAVPTTPEPAQQMRGAQVDASLGADNSATSQVKPGYRKSFDNCVTASNGVTVNMMNCINEEFDYQDKRLNIAYQRLHKVLPPDVWESLRNDQRKWLAGRDNCEIDDDIKGGTAEMLIRADCALRKTAIRANELEALFKQKNDGR
jgi:uncharacterized protein YecT (DUF1311 family)